MLKEEYNINIFDKYECSNMNEQFESTIINSSVQLQD